LSALENFTVLIFPLGTGDLIGNGLLAAAEEGAGPLAGELLDLSVGANGKSAERELLMTASTMIMTTIARTITAPSPPKVPPPYEG
jgi:hypothetical protein